MINLLNSDLQKQYRAARLNLRLRMYFSFAAVTLAIVIGVFAGGLVLTLNERSIAKQEIAANEAQTAKYKDEKQSAITFKSNLAIAKSILSQEVLYSDLIVNIAKTLPSDAVLSALTIDQQSMQKPISMSARVTSKDGAITLKTTLENSPIFENVSINSIIEEEITANSSSITRSHPVQVVLTLKVSKPSKGATH